jgi:lysozyme
MRKINEAGLKLIKEFEGCKLKAYLCPAGVLTIGYGHTGDVKEHHVITQHQADVILMDVDLPRFEEFVAAWCPNISDNQFAALVSFAFNLGLGALGRSSLLKHVQAGRYEKAADEFLKWKFAGGKVLPGLVRRREAERALFLRPV